MTFNLTGVGWQNIPYKRGARGVFLLVISGAGPTMFVGTEGVELYDESGKPVNFSDGILNSPSFTESIDVYDRKHSTTALSFECDIQSVPLDLVRRQGIILESLVVDVYWAVLGVDHDLSQAFHVLRGTMSNPVIDVDDGVVSFGVEDYTQEMVDSDRPFPPYVSDANKIATLNSEDFGKVYPVVFGSVTKMPVIEINSGAGDSFLVATDKIGDFGASAVSAMYVADGADIYAGAGASQGAAVDSEGNPYWSADPDTAAGTDRRVTADLTGHASNTPGDIVRDLINFYSDKNEYYDTTSIERLKLAFDQVEMNLAVNDKVDGGVFQVIRDRVASIVPFVIAQRGGKMKFVPLEWDRHVCKTLSTNSNILRKVQPATETTKRNVFNWFAARYNRSSYRGDFQGAVGFNKDNDHDCAKSEAVLGERPFSILDLGDVTSDIGAEFILRWYVETFSKVRVSVAYQCDVDVVDVKLWDTVQVEDEYEGWEHKPLFKVVGKTYTTGGDFVVSLLSLDSYLDVYNVNRYAETPATYSHSLAPAGEGGGWSDGAPEILFPGDGDWTDGGPNFGG